MNFEKLAKEAKKLKRTLDYINQISSFPMTVLDQMKYDQDECEENGGEFNMNHNLEGMIDDFKKVIHDIKTEIEK